MNLSVPKIPNHKIPIGQSELYGFLIRRPVQPSVWAEDNFKLTTAYARPGKLNLFPWQVEPLDSILEYDVVILCMAVQLGKSLLGESATGWIIDNLPMNTMICYAKSGTAKDVFDERLRPMIEEVPAIRKYWNGNPDNLTQRKITLSHMIMRIASAESKSDIATYSAGYIYASEVAKYPKKDFDQIKALFGRQEGYRVLGQTKAVIESSPESEGDPLHRLMYTRGVRNTKPYVPCPNCGEYQVLIDEQIKEIPNSDGELDHNPARVREEKAAKYECVHCNREIRENDRMRMSKKVVWADSSEKIVDGKVKKKRKARWISHQCGRLVDDTFSFAECLARFFEARQSVNPVALKTYQNEDMARFMKTESRQFSTNWLLVKRKDYAQYGSDAMYPAKVLLLTLGMDTQDNGFYYVIRGWGEGMESWVIKHDFIECSIKEEENKNPEVILELVKTRVIEELPHRADGVVLPITWGFIDRGGHRHKDVDFLCGRLPFLHAYTGTVNKTAPLITRSKSKGFMGHSENLSKMVESYSEGELWHLPEDIGDVYCIQFLKQFWQDKVDRHGNVLNEYVHGGADHYRDCENYNIGCAVYLQLESRLFSGNELVKLKNENAVIDKKPDETANVEGQRNKPVRQVHARAGYADRYANF